MRSHQQLRHFSIDPILEVLNQGTTYIEALHALSGIPWWGFIPILTVALRSTVTLPIAIYQRKGFQKQNSLRPIANAMSPVLKIKLAAEGQSEQMRTRKGENSPVKSEKQQLTADKIMIIASKERFKRQRKLFKDNSCQSWKFMMLPAVQIPLWVSVSYMLRVLTGWSQIGSKPLDSTLTTEGVGYLHDLALNDPYFVLPITLGILALANAEWNFATADMMKLTTRGVRNSLRPTAFDTIITLTRGSIIFLMAMATQAPAALVLYWISSNGFSLCQNLLMDRFLPIRYTPYKRFYSAKKLSKGAVPLIKY
ncbi:hypothetical protein FOA43_003431 [Brettanomyces nanus]|uniref:Membrane insertase YidC/Oxa/ALB C-terminal domain-containing protein n=1 Tax=Eeniella nana TaxID=13502 RepID=A0A875S6W6_EENNA|nr:uncharacterized protein FOA43_003431 [Brettanomyces nanus]QPG76045.1 hypothetical protein FOA43_003431 [Brettanomyces nanus]